MNLVDLAIILAVVFAIIRGIETGFFCQLGSLGGFIIGLMLGSWIAPFATKFISGATNRGVFAIVVTFLAGQMIYNGILGKI